MDELYRKLLAQLEEISRQLEELIRDSEPTILLVEHDVRFLENVCTRPAIALA